MIVFNTATDASIERYNYLRSFYFSRANERKLGFRRPSQTIRTGLSARTPPRRRRILLGNNI